MNGATAGSWPYRDWRTIYPIRFCSFASSSTSGSSKRPTADPAERATAEGTGREEAVALPVRLAHRKHIHVQDRSAHVKAESWQEGVRSSPRFLSQQETRLVVITARCESQAVSVSWVFYRKNCSSSAVHIHQWAVTRSEVNVGMTAFKLSICRDPPVSEMLIHRKERSVKQEGGVCDWFGCRGQRRSAGLSSGGVS